MIKKLFLIIALGILLAACGTSNSSKTISKEQFQQLQQTLEAQATQLASLMATSTPTNTPTPAAPASHPAVVQPTPAAPPCVVIHDYTIKGLTEVSTSKDGFLHVEFWEGANTPEYETILPGGRYLLRTNFAGGHVWEYGPGCSFDQVMEQVKAHIDRRIDQKANNGGYLKWESTGHFSPVQ